MQVRRRKMELRHFTVSLSYILSTQKYFMKNVFLHNFLEFKLTNRISRYRINFTI